MGIKKSSSPLKIEKQIENKNKNCDILTSNNTNNNNNNNVQEKLAAEDAFYNEKNIFNPNNIKYINSEFTEMNSCGLVSESAKQQQDIHEGFDEKILCKQNLEENGDL